MQGQKVLGTDLNIEMTHKPFPYYHGLHSGPEMPCAVCEIGLEGLQQLSLNFISSLSASWPSELFLFLLLSSGRSHSDIFSGASSTV